MAVTTLNPKTFSMSHPKQTHTHQAYPTLPPNPQCPAGSRCRARTHRAGVSPMMSALKNNMKNPITQAEMVALNNDLTTTVTSNDHCTRRAAMARAAGLAAGLAVATVNSPAYAAETKEVLMGSDSGQLVFVPAMLKICKGDTVKWCVPVCPCAPMRVLLPCLLLLSL